MIKLLMLIILFNSLHINSLCQVSLLDKKVSITVHKTSIKETIEVISIKSGIDFSYSDDLVSLSRKISIKANNLPLKEVLDQIFKNTNIEYRAFGNQIIIYSRKMNKMNPNNKVEEYYGLIWG